MAGDSGALPQVLGSMCVLARRGDFFFLKCILPSLCQSVNKSHQRKAGVGNYISKLQQAPQAGKLLKNKRTVTTKKPGTWHERWRRKPFYLCSTIVNHFLKKFHLKLLFCPPLIPSPGLAFIIGLHQALSRLDDEEHFVILVYPPHFFSHFTSVLEKVAPNGKSWTLACAKHTLSQILEQFLS